jgi:putative ABC transport system ATP-binding protein
MIIAENVSKRYGRAESSVAALCDVNLTVAAGERLAIVGKSGSGKSTLLNLLAGLDRPSSGCLTVAERRLDQMHRNSMAAYRRQTVGVIFQAFQLLPHRTALQNVELPLLLNGASVATRRTQAIEWLQRVGLAHRMNHLPYALSGGEQQRVAIARALVHSPALLLADEPTGNLDSATANQIQSQLLELCAASAVTFILVTHDSQLADRCCTRQVRMSDGKLTEVA